MLYMSVSEAALLRSEDTFVSRVYIGMLIGTGYLETTKKPGTASSTFLGESTLIRASEILKCSEK